METVKRSGLPGWWGDEQAELRAFLGQLQQLSLSSLRLYSMAHSLFLCPDLKPVGTAMNGAWYLGCFFDHRLGHVKKTVMVSQKMSQESSAFAGCKVGD